MGWEAPILYSGADTSGRRRGLRPRRDQDMKDVNVSSLIKSFNCHWLITH